LQIELKLREKRNYKQKAVPPEQTKNPIMQDSTTQSSGSVILPGTSLTTKSIAALLLAAVFSMAAQADTGTRAPAVPDSLQVPEGNKVSFHAYAAGVQIYVATPSTTSPSGFAWTFHAPEAVLYDGDGNIVGIHYAFAGPTRPAWETASGSRVVGIRTVPPVSVNSDSIPWLILSADPNNTIGPGVLERTTYIQRVNTAGGLAPASPPTQLGEEARVPYTAEYFFYRQK
jgi:hypothetical protein